MACTLRELETARKWRAENPEKAKEAAKRWRIQNRDRYNESRRKWRARNIVRSLVAEAKARAKQRGIEFRITAEDVPPMGETCPLLGFPFANREFGKRSAFTPSLDRIDPTKGYIPGNVWIVGYRANLIKNDGTAEEHSRIAEAMRKALVV